MGKGGGDWVKDVEKQVETFARKHAATLNAGKRELAASFEIGCLHALLNYYEGIGYALTAENLVNGEYRYLTNPNGNPHNFSYVSMCGPDGQFEVRQQVRIHSHIDHDIAFAPDMVVLQGGAELEKTMRADFAAGKRAFYTVSGEQVVAAHECKSMVPFPELLVSFVGMFVTAHGWYGADAPQFEAADQQGHIAPTLFVGGAASGVHIRMIRALEKAYPINIVVGLHEGTWNLYASNRKLNYVRKGQGPVKTMPILALSNWPSPPRAF